MLALKDFFAKIDGISEDRGRNDKIKISNSKGEIVNIIQKDNICEIEKEESKKAVIFLEILSKLTKWKYNKSDWQWNNFKLYQFKKSSTNPSNRNFEEMIKNNPLSWAMTSGLAIEYTLEDKKNDLLK